MLAFFPKRRWRPQSCHAVPSRGIAFVQIAVLGVVALATPLGVTPSQAEALSLGPFKPKVTLYGISLDPVVNVSADLVTSRDGVNAKGDVLASLRADQISDKLAAIGKKLLPVTIQVSPCTFEIQRASSLTLSVISNTGDFHANIHVAPSGCPLIAGDVVLSVRFAPVVVNSILSIKIAKLDVVVPAEWWWVGFIANKDPATQIANELRKKVEGFAFSLPAIEHVRAALQGASLDLKANDLIVRIRADAQIDRPVVMNILNKSGQIDSLSFSYP
jgi:hypothetical protein